MGLFDRFRRTKSIKASLSDFDKIWNADLDTIWNIEDKSNFVIAMNGFVSRKCNYGESLDALTSAEKIFYLSQAFEGEINDGGLSQFILNSGGIYADETLDALKTIGANQIASAYSSILKLFNEPLPKNADEREELLTDDIEEQIDLFDSLFFSYPDNLYELNYNYVLKNKEQFI